MNAILDEAFFCHVGFNVEGQPFVIPTVHARHGEQLYVHGAAASRMLKSLKGGISVCVTVTLLDGLVLARSGFNHSMNYRSAMILGVARELGAAEKRTALDVIVNHVLPGRTAEVRSATRKELNATTVLALPITEASAKIRSGPPHDDEEDYALPCWAGVLPLELTALAPQPDPRLPAGTALPAALERWSRGRSAAARR